MSRQISGVSVDSEGVPVAGRKHPPSSPAFNSGSSLEADSPDTKVARALLDEMSDEQEPSANSSSATPLLSADLRQQLAEKAHAVAAAKKNLWASR